MTGPTGGASRWPPTSPSRSVSSRSSAAGSRLAVKVLLLTLAIVDDIGAIVVIAVFYTDDLRTRPAAGRGRDRRARRRDAPSPRDLPAAAGRRRRSRCGWWSTSPVFTPPSPASSWACSRRRGRSQTELEADEIVDVLENRADLRADDVRATATLIRGSVSACDRLIDALHPWTSYVIVPIFALGQRRHRPVRRRHSPNHPRCSSASPWRSWSASSSESSRSVGSPCGSGSDASPTAHDWGHILGVGAVAGIGFTVSLFITGLAFDSKILQDDAKIGTLIASIVAAGGGAAMLGFADRKSKENEAA